MTSPSSLPALIPTPAAPSLTPIPPPTLSLHSLWPSPKLLSLDAIHPDDRADSLLMAICAALVSVDNRALCPKEIAQVVFDNHWALPPSSSQPFVTIVASIRNHLKRSEAVNHTPLLAFYILDRAPSKDERRCMGLKPESKPSVKRSSLWFLNPAATGARDPFEGVPQHGVLRKRSAKGLATAKDPFEDVLQTAPKKKSAKAPTAPKDIPEGQTSAKLKETMPTPPAPPEKKSTGITIKLRIGAASVPKPVPVPPPPAQPSTASRVVIKLNPPAASPTLTEQLSSSSSSEDEEESEEEDVEEALVEGFIRPSAMHRRRSRAYAWTSKPTQRLSSIFSTFYPPLSTSTNTSSTAPVNSVAMTPKVSEDDGILVDHELWPARDEEQEVVVVSPVINQRVESSDEEEEEELSDEEDGPEDYAEMMVSRSSEGEMDWDPHDSVDAAASRRVSIDTGSELGGRKWQNGMHSTHDLSVTLLEDEEETVKSMTTAKVEQVEDESRLTDDLTCSMLTEPITLIEQVPTIFDDLSNDSISPATTATTLSTPPTELEPITSLADKLGFTSLCETRPPDDSLFLESSPESPDSSFWAFDWQDHEDGLSRRSRKTSLTDHNQNPRPIKRLKLDHDSTAAAIDSPPTPPPEWDLCIGGSSGSLEEDESLVIVIDEDQSSLTIGFEDLDILYDTSTASAQQSPVVVPNKIEEEEIHLPKMEEEFLTSASTPKTFFVEPQVRLCEFGGEVGKVYMIKMEQIERRKWGRRDLGSFSDEWTLIRRVESGLIHLPSLIGILTATDKLETIEKDWIEIEEAIEMVKKHGCLQQSVVERFLGPETTVFGVGVG